MTADEPAASGCPAAAVIGERVYRCHSHDNGGHHFAARWPACPAPFCLLPPGHRTLHDIPSGTPEYVNTAARGCARCLVVLVDEDDQGWYCQVPADDLVPGLTLMDRVHDCDGKPHDVISRLELARLIRHPAAREIPIRRRAPAEARARMVAGGIPGDIADEILAGDADAAP